MRSTARRRLVPALIAAVALTLWGIVSASAQDQPALSLEVDSFQILRQDAPGDEPRQAFVMRQGQRYQFRIHYEVGGAEAIRTSHTYAYEEVATGRRIDVDSRSFDPEPAGAYNEFSARVINDDWAPGAYRLVWTLRATAVSATSAAQEGSLVFLVAGPTGP